MEVSDVDADVDVRDPDEKSIMTYVAQFLQYSRDVAAQEDEMQVSVLIKVLILSMPLIFPLDMIFFFEFVLTPPCHLFPSSTCLFPP